MELENYNTKAAIRALNFMVFDDDKYELGTFVDQDGHSQIVLKGEYYNELQLDQLYDNLFGTGTMCIKRSKKWDEISKLFPEGTTPITIASIFQDKCLGCSDMMLACTVSAVVDGIYK